MAFATHERELAASNRTSMLHVLLVVLVIFMAAAPLMTKSLSLQLPHASATASTPTELRLQIDRAGDYSLDGRPLSAAALGDALHMAQARTPDLRLRIASANDSDYQAFVGALSVARRAGVRNIGSELR